MNLGRRSNKLSGLFDALPLVGEDDFAVQTFLDNYYQIKSRYHRLQVTSLQDNKGQFIALPIEMTEKAICETMFTNFCKSTPGAFDT